MRDTEHDKHLKRMKLPASASLTDLKQRYAELNAKFERQIRSGDEAKAQRGRNNIRLLNQSFTVLSGSLIASKHENETILATETQDNSSPVPLTIELFSTRVGFQVLEGGLFALETKRVDVNLFGLRASRSNASLKASWPAGKLIIYNDHIEVSCLLGSESVSLKQIEQIEKVWYLPGSVVIRRKPPLEDSKVVLTGWGLAGKIKAIVRQNRLKIRLAY